MALKWGDFASQGALGNVCRHFWLSHHGVLTVGEQRMFNRVIAEHPPMHRAEPRKKNDSVRNVSIAAAQSPALMHTGAPTSGPQGTGLCLLQPPHQALAGAGSQSTPNDKSAGRGTLRGNT